MQFDLHFSRCAVREAADAFGRQRAAPTGYERSGMRGYDDRGPPGRGEFGRRDSFDGGGGGGPPPPRFENPAVLELCSRVR